jgi:predicted GNAT superfamily acetyltransferase
MGLAQTWRFQTRSYFEEAFRQGYLLTDFIFIRGDHPRSFYVFSDGERRLGVFKKD